MISALVSPNALSWGISLFAVAGVIMRPRGWPEAIWAMLGALALVALELLPWRDALAAARKGTDVYLFLTGMMLLSEMARREGLFDHLAAYAARHARGSATRLFALVYGVGVAVTVFLSNDATAVVLTPAVYAAARAAKAEPLPYLLICAFVANAASFVLPISNPANLVVFGSAMPPLLQWLARFTLPSALAIGATYVALRLAQRRALAAPLATDVAVPPLSRAGQLAALGIAATAAVLLGASAVGLDLGLPTCLAGMATVALVLAGKREAPWDGIWGVLRGVSWSVLPLVAGLFVLVESLDRTGVIRAIGDVLRDAVARSPDAAVLGAGAAIGVASNLVNNLPAGLIAGSAVTAQTLPPTMIDALLIGVDLGPNLSITGSLATILWLAALRREGMRVGFWAFLRLGLLVMPPALLLALAASVWSPVRLLAAVMQ